MRICFLIFIIYQVLFFISCQKLIESNNTELIANAGPDQTTIVGSYAILDASQSSGDIDWYEWEQDENNPAEVNIFSGNDDFIQKIGFVIEGVYKFYLTVKNGVTPGNLNGTSSSTQDEVTVTVLPNPYPTFEDPYLEVHVRYALKKPTEELTETDFLSLDSLTVNRISAGGAVTSLNGIEKCTNLEYLGMGHQRIVDLSPLARLTKLTFLNLTQNRHIKDISPLAGLMQLRYLDLDSNEIPDMSPLLNLTQLTYLNVMWNPIDDISVVANMKNLEELWISHSPIADISPVADLKKLSFLWLSKCEIADITPITNLTSLQLLYLKHNYITDISPLAGLVHLERLYLEDNQIVDISPLENLRELDLLILSKNQISDILPLVNNSGLEEGDFVSLSSNPLNEISINEYIPALRNRGVIVIWP